MRKLSELEKERRDDLRAKAQTAFSGSCQAAQKPPGQASLESSGSASDTDDPVLAAYGRYIAGKRAAARDTRQQVREPIRVDKTPGRNDPCPCGSGKKFKNCHGQGL